MPLTLSERFRKSVLESIRHRGLLGGGECVIAAVSGGSDSTALLCVLHALQTKLDLRIVAAHIHHGLRGADADKDAEAVRSLAGTLDVEFIVKNIDLSSTVEGAGNVEDVARYERYRTLAAMAEDIQADAIATGHNKNDQAETVLHRLIRSAGPCGTQGIRPQVELFGMRFIRPLLDCSREDIHAYLQDNGKTWQEDATNCDVEYSRNRLRHCVIPELKKINSETETALSRFADIMAVDEAYFETEVAQAAERLFERHGSELRADIKKLRELPKAIRWRLWRWLGNALGERAGAADSRPGQLVNFEQIKQLERLVLGQEGKGLVHMRSGILVVRRRNTLAAYRQE